MIFSVLTVVWVPFTVRLPLITTFLPVISPFVVKLLFEKLIPVVPDDVILPLEIVISPISALVSTDNVPSEVIVSATIPLVPL